MKELETLIARAGRSHWVLLSESVGGWTFLIWGKYPLGGDFGKVSASEAKKAALSAAKEHLGRHGLERELTHVSELPWRVAVRYTAA